MGYSEIVIWMWFFPVVTHIVIPLIMLTAWSMARSIKVITHRFRQHQYKPANRRIGAVQAY